MSEPVPPVLFLVFNRPDVTARVFAAIRAARPARLYVAADGARANKAGERERCAEVRRIATAVDWPCEIRTLYRDENLGCRDAVSGGIDWLFANEAEGIILEDDIEPLPSFFTYAQAMLERYRDDPRVMMVNGSNVISDRYSAADSYFFSSYAHVWGWASWRRAWQLYDVGISDWPHLRNNGGLQADVTRRWGWGRLMHANFDRVYEHRLDTWDYQWTFALLKHAGLAITPRVNLVRNIGFGADATHTSGEAPAYLRNAVTMDLEFPLAHPLRVVRDPRADRIEERDVMTTPWRERMMRTILRLDEAPLTHDIVQAALACKRFVWRA